MLRLSLCVIVLAQRSLWLRTSLKDLIHFSNVVVKVTLKCLQTEVVDVILKSRLNRRSELYFTTISTK